jgi:1-deoxy-D-xylulose-5-phosphate reductoisomerase
MNINLPEINSLKRVAKSQKKDVTILGSTGSIGCNTLDLIGRDKNNYNVISLTAHQNVKKLAEQAIKFKATMAVIADDKLLADRTIRY